jgi:hypothetical protein
LSIRVIALAWRSPMAAPQVLPQSDTSFPRHRRLLVARPHGIEMGGLQPG